MRGAIQLKMIGWELIQNNNIICIFSRKLNYFSSTSTIIVDQMEFDKIRWSCPSNNDHNCTQNTAKGWWGWWDGDLGIVGRIESNFVLADYTC